MRLRRDSCPNWLVLMNDSLYSIWGQFHFVVAKMQKGVRDRVPEQAVTINPSYEIIDEDQALPLFKELIALTKSEEDCLEHSKRIEH